MQAGGVVQARCTRRRRARASGAGIGGCQPLVSLGRRLRSSRVTPPGRRRRNHAGSSPTVASCQVAPCPCHAEGRGFEPHHPLLRNPLETAGFAFRVERNGPSTEPAGQHLGQQSARPGTPDPRDHAVVCLAPRGQMAVLGSNTSPKRHLCQPLAFDYPAMGARPAPEDRRAYAPGGAPGDSDRRSRGSETL